MLGLSIPILVAATGAGISIKPSVGHAEEIPDDDPLVYPFWNDDGYFVQKTVDMTNFDSNQTLRAFVDGKWQTYNVRSLSDGFIDWNLSNRMSRLDDPMGTMSILSGPHNGAVATYGSGRGDSRFSLNNAFKGFGPLPKDDLIVQWTERLTSEWYAELATKLETLKELYSDENNFDFRMLASIELYTTKEFQTHTFMNQMTNPISTIVFLDSPEGSFELRTIARLMDPLDEDLPESEFNRLKWVNVIHDYFHGGPSPDTHGPYRIGATYYVIEEFDDSPASGKKGLRTVPQL
jgi:hypothetical protein